MLIMYIILFPLSHENCDCYGNRSSQNVSPVGDFCVAGNTCAFLKAVTAVVVLHGVEPLCLHRYAVKPL